jgi:hypothetical protein
MWYAYVADLVVAFHFAYVGFILVGQVLILLGLALRWHCVRNPWFRVAHLLAIAFVGLEAVWDITCPLTTWEQELRQLAGQEVSEGSFIGRWLHYLLFYRVENWILNLSHISFALLVLLTFILAPPRWRQKETTGHTARRPPLFLSRPSA